MIEPVARNELLIDYRLITNPRKQTGLSDSEIEELALDIFERGILQEPVAQRFIDPDDPEKVVTVILDGQRRKLAIDRLVESGRRDATDGDDVVFVKHLYGPEPIPYTNELAVKAMLDALAIGKRRQGLSSYEETVHAHHLRESGATNEEIGKAIERSPTWVSRMLSAYTNAMPALAEAWKDGKLPDEQVKDLAKVPQQEQADAVKETLRTRESGDRAARGAARAQAKAKAPPPAARAVPKPGAGEASGAAEASSDRPPHPPQSKAAIAELIAMRRDFPAREPYMKGFLDAAAFIGGYLLGVDLPKAVTAYLNDVSNRKAKKQSAAETAAHKMRAQKQAKDARKSKNGKAGAAVRKATTKAKRK
jgi:hypothetical protein